MTTRSNCIIARQRCTTAYKKFSTEIIDMQSDNDYPYSCPNYTDLGLLCVQAMVRESRFSEETGRICADAYGWCTGTRGQNDIDHIRGCAEAHRGMAA